MFKKSIPYVQLCMNWLNPRSRTRAAKLQVPHLVKKIPILNGPHRSITPFKVAHTVVFQINDYLIKYLIDTTNDGTV